MSSDNNDNRGSSPSKGPEIHHRKWGPGGFGSGTISTVNVQLPSSSQFHSIPISPSHSATSIKGSGINLQTSESLSKYQVPSINLSAFESKIVTETPKPSQHLHRMSASQRRERLMRRTTTLSNYEYAGPSQDDEYHYYNVPQIMEDLNVSSNSSGSSTPTKSNCPPQRADGGPPCPGLLFPPSPITIGGIEIERPPHRRDTLEKIPIRARSQSWLIRTRHLYDDPGTNKTSIVSIILYAVSVFFLALTLPWSLMFCVKICKEYERAVIFRLGRLLGGSGLKGPGLYFVIPCMDTYKIVDLRVLSFDVPAQEILSRDSVTVSVEAVIYFRISNPVISVTNVNDAQFSTKLLAQTTLRNVLGTKTLSEILQESLLRWWSCLFNGLFLGA
uniref:PHB domain-containing protein n=1 Tax=Rhabditophanes sp. KR3021 TaxID=114890 RepID=A0AC35UAK8_9BILA